MCYNLPFQHISNRLAQTTDFSYVKQLPERSHSKQECVYLVIITFFTLTRMVVQVYHCAGVSSYRYICRLCCSTDCCVVVQVCRRAGVSVGYDDVELTVVCCYTGAWRLAHSGGTRLQAVVGQ